MTRTNGRSLAPAPDVADARPDARYALMPQTYAEAFSMAGHFAKSGMFAAKSPEQAVVVLMTGMEMGLSPAMAMRGIDVIQGRPVPGAATLMAACLVRKDVCRFFTVVDTDEARAVYKTHRVGADAPVEMAYTIEQAKQAGLTGKDNWRKHTAEMLRSRCTSALARAVYPDLCLGLYIADEAEEMDRREEPSRAEPRNVTPPAGAGVAPALEGGDALREARRQKQAEIIAAMSEIPPDQRTAWLDRFEAAYGLRNVKQFGLPQMDEAISAISAKNWPHEAAFQAKQEEIRRAAKADLEDDPFGDSVQTVAPAPALLDMSAADEKGHGDS